MLKMLKRRITTATRPNKVRMQIIDVAGILPLTILTTFGALYLGMKPKH